MRRPALAVALLALALLPGAARPAPAAPAARPGVFESPFRAAIAGGGRLDLVRGVAVLRLQGTPREMGRQHGELLREPIHALVDGYLVPFLGGRAAVAAAATTARATLGRHVPADYREEIAGLAEGAGLDEDVALLAQAFLDLRKTVMCSTIAVTGDRSAAGEPLLARNLDFPALGVAERYSLVIVRRPAGGTPTATVGWPSMIGSLSGLSERGLALAMMEVYEGRTRLDGMPFPLLYRQVLEGAATAGEAVAMLRAAARSTSNNVMVVDADGGAAVVEVSADAVATRGPDRGVVFATNHFRALAAGEPASCRRYATLSRSLAGGATLDAPALERLLDRVDLGEANLQAMILAPRSRSMRLSVGRAPAAAGPYVPLDAKTLFGPPDP